MHPSSRKQNSHRMLTWWILLPMLHYSSLVVSANEKRRNTYRRQKGLSFAKPRIVGGTPAAPGAYPFYVHTSGSELCGGTLIAPDIVLTAAHCDGAFLDGVLIGALRLDGTDAVERIEVESEFPHPDFVDATRVNDIMLVKLAEPSTSPIVEMNFDPTNPAEGDVLTVIGFGDTMTDGEASNDLLTVNVDAYSDDFCFDLYTTFDPATQICAGTAAGGRDSCQGDSGGPLLSTSNQQVGIVSFGEGCGQADIPSVYAEVAAYETFIRTGICSLSDSPPATCDTTTSPLGAPVSPPSGTSAPTVAPVDSPVSPPTGTAAPVDSPVAPPTVTATPVESPVAPPANPVTPTDTASPTITFQPTITPQPSITAFPTADSPEPTMVQPPSVTTSAPIMAPAGDEPTSAPAGVEPTLAPTEAGPVVEPTLAPTIAPTIDVEPDGPTHEPTLEGTEEPTVESTFVETKPPSHKGGGMKMGKGGDESGGMMMGKKGGKGGMMMGKGGGKGGMMMGKGTMKIHYGKGIHINGNTLFHNDDDNDSSAESDLLKLIFGPSA